MGSSLHRWLLATGVSLCTMFYYLSLFRLRNALKSPVSCSTPSGPITPLQTNSSAKERSVRRKKEKQDDDQLIIVRKCLYSLVERYILYLYHIGYFVLKLAHTVFSTPGRRPEAVWSDDLQLMWDGVQRRQPRGQFPTQPVPPALPRLHQICGKTFSQQVWRHLQV